MIEGIFNATRLRLREGLTLPVAHQPTGALIEAAAGAPTRSSDRSCAFIVISNFAHLREAYGLPFALGVSLEIKSRIGLRFIARGSTALVCLRDDCYLLWTNSSFTRGASLAERMPSESLEDLLAALGAPVQVHGVEAMPQVHANWIPMPNSDSLRSSEVELLSWAWAAQSVLAGCAGSEEISLYRADMAIAIRVSSALAAGHHGLWWQPVVDGHAAAATFYREACLRIASGQDGAPGKLAADGFMPSLERLGLTRTFDRQMVRSVVNGLRLQPGAVMSVRISAQSATLDHWWASLLRVLSADADLARRLIVEIGATSALADLASASEFCAQLRARGCRIAISGFGVGEIRIQGLLACRPDILKLDASFARNARDDEAARDSLRDMLAMCGRLSAHVVVDGIDGESELQIAMEAGARWMQGYYLGSPDAPSRREPERRTGTPSAQEEGDSVLLPDVLVLSGACALGGASLVLALHSLLPLYALAVGACAIGIALQRAIFSASQPAANALQRPSSSARLVLGLLGFSSGLAAGSLMTAQFAAALCVGGGIVLGSASGWLWQSFMPETPAFPGALRRMRLPVQPASDPAARALACADRAALLLSQRAIGGLPAPAALQAYMDGVASGFYGLGSAAAPQDCADSGAVGPVASVLHAIWRVGTGHGDRIRSERTRSERTRSER